VHHHHHHHRDRVCVSSSSSFSLKIACKKYEAAIQMLQDMNDRYSSTLAMLGLVKALLVLDTQKQMVTLIFLFASFNVSMKNTSRVTLCCLLSIDRLRFLSIDTNQPGQTHTYTWKDAVHCYKD
jgi:hypothetical protein